MTEATGGIRIEGDVAVIRLPVTSLRTLGVAIRGKGYGTNSASASKAELDRFLDALGKAHRAAQSKGLVE